MIDPMRHEQVAQAVDRSSAGVTTAQPLGKRGASFEGALRELERNLEMMLEMPAVRMAGAAARRLRLASEPAFERFNTAHDATDTTRDAVKTVAQPIAENQRPGEHVASSRNVATDARTSTDPVEQRCTENGPGAPSPGASDANPEVPAGPSAPDELEAGRGIADADSNLGAFDARVQALTARRDAAREAVTTFAAAESGVRVAPARPQAGGLAPVDNGARIATTSVDGVPARGQKQIVAPQSESNPSGASAVAHLATKGAAVAIRIGQLSPRSVDDLVDRVRQLLRAHGVESYELFLNGERIDLAPPTSGSRSWR